ncbi:hypothetical protein AMECASPLE_031264, partial [Ameca splendens]
LLSFSTQSQLLSFSTQSQVCAPDSVDVIYVVTSSDLTNSSSDNVHLVYSTDDMGDLSYVQELDAAINVDILEDSGTVTFFTGHISNTDSLCLDDTLPLSSVI